MAAGISRPREYIALNEIVKKVGGFIAALPPGAGAEDAHNTDWLFTEKALKLGALATVVNRLLYFHN